MVPGICLALSSQFCFVWADLITVYALPTRWWGDSPLRPHQQSEHSSYQFSGAGRKRAPLFQLFPKKVLVLFRLLFGHILQEREKYTHGPALDHMLNPGTRKKGQWKGMASGQHVWKLCPKGSTCSWQNLSCFWVLPLIPLDQQILRVHLGPNHTMNTTTIQIQFPAL